MAETCPNTAKMCPDTVKTCAKCGLLQPLERFPFRKAEQTYRGTCKACRAAESRALRSHPAHTERIREAERLRSLKRRPAIKQWQREHRENMRAGERRREARRREKLKRIAYRHRPFLKPFRAILPPPTVKPMPSLPKPTRRPWQPAPQKRAYVPHAARSPEYGTARWQAARAAQLARCPCCEACTKQGRTTAATVADHLKPVRLGGDFWDSANHQSLCRPCHQAKSASERHQHPQGG